MDCYHQLRSSSYPQSWKEANADVWCLFVWPLGSLTLMTSLQVSNSSSASYPIPHGSPGFLKPPLQVFLSSVQLDLQSWWVLLTMPWISSCITFYTQYLVPLIACILLVSNICWLIIYGHAHWEFNHTPVSARAIPTGLGVVFTVFEGDTRTGLGGTVVWGMGGVWLGALCDVPK